MAETKVLTIYERLNAIQSELVAPKGQTNTFGKYKYRSCEDIINASKPLLKKYECVLLLTDEIDLIGQRYYVRAIATLHCGNEQITVSASAREEETKKGMDSSQITGAASSYARKYALNGLFAIDDTKDADTQDNTKIEPEVEEPTPLQKRLNWLNAVFLSETGKKQLPNYLALYKIKSIDELTLEQADDLVKTIRANAKPKQ